jgi:uncharacterized membrane protein (UPF0136 family)
MAIESEARRVPTGVGSEARSRLMVSAAVVAAYALLLAVLVVIIYFEDRSILVPLVVVSAAGLIVAAVMAATRKRWTAWLAAVYSVIALVADGPHQVPEVLHPVSVTHTVGAVILLVVGVVAIAVALRAALGRDI